MKVVPLRNHSPQQILIKILYKIINEVHATNLKVTVDYPIIRMCFGESIRIKNCHGCLSSIPSRMGENYCEKLFSYTETFCLPNVNWRV
jgi:hypothetical protein